MNTLSARMRCLLDKNIARLAVVGQVAASHRPPTSMEQGAVLVLSLASQYDLDVFLPSTSVSVLRQFTQYAEARDLLAYTQVLLPGRYSRRWGRRIRNVTGLTREDASILSLGTFGTNEAGSVLGVNFIVTYDYRLMNGFANHSAALARRLQAMRVQLAEPFRAAVLPLLLDPPQLFQQLTAK